MTDYLKPKGINKKSWADVRTLSKQKFPEIIVEPKKTSKNMGSSDTVLLQEMFPGSPVNIGQLNNVIVSEQKETLLSKGIVDDEGHTFGKVDRSFKESPGPIELDFDISQLLDVTPYWHITGSIRTETTQKKRGSAPIKPLSVIADELAEYEEGLVSLFNQTIGTITFAHVFSSAPYVVLTVEPTVDNQSNINVFGLTLPTNTGLLFGTSAPFTGQIRYRATVHPTNIWPRSVSSVYTSSMHVYAGEYVAVNVNQFTSNFSFPSTPSGSIIYLSTMYDAYFNRTADTGITSKQVNILSPTNWSADSNLSEYVTTKIHFLAFKV